MIIKQFPEISPAKKTATQYFFLYGPEHLKPVIKKIITDFNHLLVTSHAIEILTASSILYSMEKPQRWGVLPEQLCGNVQPSLQAGPCYSTRGHYKCKNVTLWRLSFLTNQNTLFMVERRKYDGFHEGSSYFKPPM